MKRKKLAGMPVPAKTVRQKELCSLSSESFYLISTQKVNAANEDTLVLNIFKSDTQEETPMFRMFCQYGDYVFQNLSGSGPEWRTAEIWALLRERTLYYKAHSNIMVDSVDSYSRILEFLDKFKDKCNDMERTWFRHDEGGYNVSGTIEAISCYQSILRGRRLRRRHEREKQLIDEQMEMFKSLPDDFRDFVEDTVFEDDNVIFYQAKRLEARCTRCGTAFKLTKERYLTGEAADEGDGNERVKHNKEVTCPVCRKPTRCRSRGMGQKSLLFFRWSVLLQNWGDAVLVRYFRHSKDLRGGYDNVNYQTNELYRSVHSRSGSSYYRWGQFKREESPRWCNSCFGFVYGGICTVNRGSCPEQVVVYSGNLTEVLQGTCMRYSALECFLCGKGEKDALHYEDPWIVDRYLTTYRKEPTLEQLCRVGFTAMARELIRRYTPFGFQEGGSIVQKLGISKEQYRMLREIEGASLHDVELLRKYPWIKESDFFELRNLQAAEGWCAENDYVGLLKLTALRKAREYFEAQGVAHHSDYFEYLGWMHEMGYDLRKKANLFPKHFRAAHDRRYREYAIMKEKAFLEAKERFDGIMSHAPGQFNALLAELHYGNLFARFPATIDELKQEGDSLNHCVGTYAERVAKGKTFIFLIRKEDVPGEPFYTLEWNERVVQCRGCNNASMTEEVSGFVKEMQSKIAVAAEALHALLSESVNGGESHGAG